MCNHRMQFVYIGFKRFCAPYGLLCVIKIFAFEHWILLCTPVRGEARCGAELLVLAGVKAEGLIHVSQIYFVAPINNCLKFWQSSDTWDLWRECQLLCTSYSATALHMLEGCWFGAVSAGGACSEHCESAVPLLGRRWSSTIKVPWIRGSAATTGD